MSFLLEPHVVVIFMLSVALFLIASEPPAP
jgi:hypothetical protein